MDKQYSIGIDLGTSNSVLAIAEQGQSGVKVLEVTQLASANTFEEQKTLASALYLPHQSEFSEKSLNLPWSSAEESRTYVVGSLAREHGSLVPDRLITSAKSWLCNSHVDRREAILPWKSEIEEEKYSPVAASTLFLEHLRANLEFHREKLAPETTLNDVQAVLTVPASFDEVARSLTHEAAELAGWKEVILLEEPQAAFYSWIAESEGAWREQIQAGDIVLVCDVGGGTADFSMIAVSEQQGELQLNRISVGDHILLGGDNMDLALAYTVRGELEREGASIDEWQFLVLVHLARAAKERLFSDENLEEIPVSIPSRGSSLFAKTISTKITREQARGIILEGFIPLVESQQMPEERKSVGLQEYGLSYATDPALSKHLARFLADSLKNIQSDEALSQTIGEHLCSGDHSFLKPTAVLFNGGVFKASPIRERVLSLLCSWSPEHEIRELQGGNLDLAVAQGASYYGRILIEGQGLRIRAGTARSYYLGLETSMPAVPGYSPPVKGLCVVPQGTEEGTELVLGEKEFGLVCGEQVEFRFFSSTTRAGDPLGSLIENAEKDLDETSRLQITLPMINDKAAEVIPVKLSAQVTELGTLELWMQHTQSEQKWKLDFNLRAKD